MAEPLFVSTSQAAKLCGVTRRTVLNWINDNQVPYVRLPGGEYRLPRRLLIELLKEGVRGFDLEEELRRGANNE